MNVQFLYPDHRRRINTEGKANVVTAVWETLSTEFLAALAIYTRTVLNNRMNSFFSLNHPGAIHVILQFVLMQNSYSGKELNQFCLQRQPLPDIYCTTIGAVDPAASWEVSNSSCLGPLPQHTVRSFCLQFCSMLAMERTVFYQT